MRKINEPFCLENASKLTNEVLYDISNNKICIMRLKLSFRPGFKKNYWIFTHKQLYFYLNYINLLKKIFIN